MLKITNTPNIIEWNKFVYDHPNGNIFQTSKMYEVYKRTKNYEPIILAVLNNSNDILALVQAVTIKETEGIFSKFTARAVIQGGPLWIEGEQGTNALRLLMNHYDEIMQKRVLYTQIRNMCDMSKLSTFFGEIGYVYEDHLNFLIDLSKSKDDLWSALTKSRRRGVKSAKKNNLTVEVMTEKKTIPIFYGFVGETYQKIGLPLVDISIFNAVNDILVPNNMAKFFIVMCDGECIGGRVILSFKNTIYAWYRGSKSEYTKLYPNDLMGWDTIERFHENGFQILDFGGAGKPEENYGPRDFKKQFGGRLVNFGRFRKDYHPNKLKFSMGILQFYRMINKFL